MNGKVLNTDQVYNNYGMTVVGSIEGTDIVFKEFYKRITPRISGYYVFESEVSDNQVSMNNDYYDYLDQSCWSDEGIGTRYGC